MVVSFLDVFSLLVTFLVVIPSTWADFENRFDSPDGTYQYITGSLITITWQNLVGNPINLTLIHGSDSDEVLLIAENIENDGHHFWWIPQNISSSPNYRIRLSWVGFMNHTFSSYTEPLFITPTLFTGVVSYSGIGPGLAKGLMIGGPIVGVGVVVGIIILAIWIRRKRRRKREERNGMSSGPNNQPIAEEGVAVYTNPAFDLREVKGGVQYNSDYRPATRLQRHPHKL
ncbi:hypothetical protein ABW19_dt0201458 [Dactylella cylindrospora]|nr:hypothetical protein ABW19_dt0201458 [Dactylella cylindrospora]